MSAPLRSDPGAAARRSPGPLAWSARRRGWPLACAIALLTLAGCGGDPAGEPCELTSGALGFGFDDPCASRCLELEDVTCPDGSVVREAVCAGREGCDPGGCPAGQACYSFEDPFEEEFFCIPEEICPAPPTSAEERLVWELQSRRRSDALRAEFAERMKRRAGSPKATTAPAEPIAPVVTPLAPTPAGSVLVEAWGADLAFVACLSGNTLATGADCARLLPAGTELVHAGWRRRVTGAKALECPATSARVAGVATEQIEAAAGAGDGWGWVPAPPPSWRPARRGPLDPVLEEVVRSQLPAGPAGMRLELAVAADLDGDPNEERVIRIHYSSADPDKPGRTILWLIDDASSAPLPTGGMELNGAAEVRGVVPLDTGGALLVFTTKWMGGSGVHVVGPVAGGLGPIAEVVCGS